MLTFNLGRCSAPYAVERTTLLHIALSVEK